MKTFLAFFAIQGLLITVDEVFCHYRRYVPPWERWGHPLDTLVMLIPLLLLWSSSHITWDQYWPMALISSIFITKDEWIHARFCSGLECWLHAVLFLIHPLVLLLAWNVYKEQQHFPGWIILLPFTFMIYQLFYWNYYANRSIAKRPTNC